MLKLCECGCGKPAPIMKTNNRNRGIIKGCPYRFIKGHSIRIRKKGLSFPNWKGDITKHRLYYVWHHMIDRCYNEKSNSYREYGKRGIKVVAEWFDADTFISWGKSNGWKRGHEIDRKNNNEGYSPSNCRFVTRGKNAQNTRASKIWHIKNVSYPSLRAAAGFIGVSSHTIFRWCSGGMQHGKYYPPKKDCWAELLYREE